MTGHKKPGLNEGSAGSPFAPGLFSELFNVAASRPAQMTTEPSKSSPQGGFRQDELMVNPISAHCYQMFLFAFSACLS